MEFRREGKKESFNPKYIKPIKGYDAFHYALLVNGSYENTSNYLRKDYVLNVFANETRSNSDEDILVGFPLIVIGNKMESKFFLILFKG